MALWECHQLWPGSIRPDVVVSLGTGTDKACTSPKAPNFRHVIQDGFIPRLYRSFLSSLDGQSTWQELVNRLDQKAREDYFRLNVSLTGQPLAIDDTTCMESLRASVHLHPCMPNDSRLTAAALLASNFFFEMDALPEFDARLLRCRGVIKSRLQGTVLENAISRVFGTPLVFATESETLGIFDAAQDTCRVCHRFAKFVEFYVRHPSDLVSIQLQNGAEWRRKISSFPQTIEWFVKQQNLDAVFGAPNHDGPGGLHCSACANPGMGLSLKRKRESPLLVFSPGVFKRPRLQK